VSTTDLHGSTAVVTGASRGFGRAVAIALHQAGAEVVAVARDGERLEALRAELGDRLTPVVADAADRSWPAPSWSGTDRARWSSTPARRR